MAAGLSACAPSLVVPKLEAPAEVTVPSARGGRPLAITRAPAPEPPSELPTSCVAPEREVRRPPSRDLARLRSEHDTVEALFSATDAKSADYAKLALRLGDLENELSLLEPTRDREHKSVAESHYREATSGPAESAIEAKYRLAIDAECRKDLPMARKLQFEIVQNAPNSRLVPYAYFAFGELFLHEADGNEGMLPLAEQAFKKVIEWPASPISPLARKRLDEVRLRMKSQ
jgi:hypothetical protein